MNNLREAGNPQNWFLLENPTDPGDQLKWIESQLRKAEKEGYFVWIIGHVHPKSTLNDWIMRYNALVDRYSYVIRSQFFGHSHVDHIAFFPTFSDPKKLASYHMISPSLTTSSFLNPQYRVLTVDYDTLLILAVFIDNKSLQFFQDLCLRCYLIKVILTVFGQKAKKLCLVKFVKLISNKT